MLINDLVTSADPTPVVYKRNKRGTELICVLEVRENPHNNKQVSPRLLRGHLTYSSLLC